MAVQLFDNLPLPVRTVVMSDDVSDINQSMHAAFGLSEEQYDYVLAAIRRVILGELGVLDFSDYVAKMPNAEAISVRDLALRIALERLWPLQSYLGNVDTLIRRLGGVVPPLVPLPAEELSEEGENEKVLPAPERSSVSELLRAHPEYGELYLTQKPLKDDDDRLKSPTARNWLADYLHTMGAEGASSLKRSQYMSKSRNVALLNEEEKKNLLNFFVSQEEHTPMYWRVADDQYLVVDSELPKETQELQERDATSARLPQLLSYYEDIEDSYQKLFSEKKQGIEVEVAGQEKKLYDIIWDALGFGETERCLAALDLAISRNTFFDLIKTDRRFVGIVSREIEARWGLEAKNVWDKDLGKQAPLAIFWRLILIGKMGLEEGRAAVVADHFSKKLKIKQSPIYLDLKKGGFLFRPVEYKNRRLQFSEQN